MIADDPPESVLVQVVGQPQLAQGSADLIHLLFGQAIFWRSSKVALSVNPFSFAYLASTFV